MEQLVDSALEDEDMQEATRDSLGQQIAAARGKDNDKHADLKTQADKGARKKRVDTRLARADQLRQLKVDLVKPPNLKVDEMSDKMKAMLRSRDYDAFYLE